MVIIMDPDATAENIKSVISVIHDAGLEAKVMEGAAQQIVGVIGNIDEISRQTSEHTQTISAAAEEQSASATEIATASQSLAKLAQQLQDATKKFKV